MNQALDDRNATIRERETELDMCEACGHSRRNHDARVHACARPLCDCGSFDDSV
jgi:hypothetical protein